MFLHLLICSILQPSLFHLPQPNPYKRALEENIMNTRPDPRHLPNAAAEVIAITCEELPPPDIYDDLLLGSGVLLLFILLLGMWMIPTSAVIAFALADASSSLLFLGVA
jgi:hypothetical protein